MALASETQQQVFELLARSSNLSFISAEEVETSIGPGQKSFSFAPGQRVTAEVTSQPQNGRIPVDIGGQKLQLDLQMAVRVGQNLELTFIGNEPRPTFAIAKPGVTLPPVSLSDASRLLSLLVSNEQFMDPRLRSSLQSIAELLRQSSGETGVLASFLDDFLTYRTAGKPVVTAPGALFERPEQQVGDEARQKQQTGNSNTAAANSSGGSGRALASFEDTASRMLLNLAQRARFTLVDVANQPSVPLPLKPGDEAAALVQGRLPGGRVLVQMAGEPLELLMSRPVVQGEIIRLALVSQQPKLVFALLGQPVREQPGNVSEAARWLNALSAKESVQNDTQQMVMSRLHQIVSSLPPGSSALAAIQDEAMLYNASASLSAKTVQQQQGQQPSKNGDEVFKLLQALLNGNRLSLVEPKTAADNDFSMFRPGQQFRGDVMKSLGDDRFMVNIAGKNLEFALPKWVKPGDGLNLFFVAENPPAFLLIRHGKGNEAIVSQTGRWVGSLLGSQNQSAPLHEGLGVLQTLLKAAPDDPEQLEQVLRNGLKASGLFYEAHLSRWFSGDYPLERLMQEPQGRLAANPDETLENLMNLRKEQTGSVPLDDSADPRTLPIIKEQLATLQTGQLLFHGELFPGQQMEWRIKDREGRGRGGEHENTAPWETSVTLTLLKLGRVQAFLSLDGNRLDLRVEADSNATARLLEQEQAVLQEQLLASGLEPGELRVSHE